jgi:uncharacterized membrane protein YdjX (TVP38/TMEM64 family)
MSRASDYKHLHILGGIIVLLIVTGIILGGTIVCGFYKSVVWCQWWPDLTLTRIVQFIESSGYWGAGVSMGIMVIHSFVPFPAEFIAIANGMIFGAFWGTVITWAGAMLGAFLAFGLSRKLGRPFVQGVLTAEKMQTVDRWAQNYGGGTLLISRLIPVIAGNFINYVAGLTRVSWWTFAWTTGIGILPMTILMVIMGVGLASFSWELKFLVLIAAIGVWYMAHQRLREYRKGLPGE